MGDTNVPVLTDVKKIFSNLIFEEDTGEEDVDKTGKEPFDGPAFLKKVNQQRSMNSVLIQQRYMQAKREETAKERGEEALEIHRLKRSSYVAFQGSLGLEEDEAEILLEAPLKIQSHEILRLWFEHYFVFRSNGLFYYKDKAAFDEGKPPVEKIYLHDLITPQGKAADLLSSSNLFSRLLGVHHWFQLHTENQVFTISTPTQAIQKLWVDTINERYEEFQNDVAARNGLMENAWMWGEAESWEYIQNLVVQGNSVDSIVEKMGDELLENLEEQMTKRTNIHFLQMTFEAWKIYTRRKTRAKRLRARKAAALAELKTIPGK